MQRECSSASYFVFICNASSSDKDFSIVGARPIALLDIVRKLLYTRVRLLESAA
jgi:hypothetical protein